jgi:hypothetical protein
MMKSFHEEIAVKTLLPLALACTALLLSSPMAVLANDGAALPDDRRPIVLAQVTPKSKAKLSAQCPQGQVRRCNAVEGKQKCACVPKGTRAMKGKPQTLIHGSNSPGGRY